MHRLQAEPLDLAALLAATDSADCGALVVFGGTVRNANEGRPVSGMAYSAYAPLAEKLLAEIEQDTLRRFDIRHCRIQHRTGELALGELSVLVVVRAAHRDAAFAAARHAIDTLKQRVPIWKQEHYPDGDSRYLEGVPLSADGEQPFRMEQDAQDSTG
ncbi:MAG TPA: molybdenum cofactor biosynthesis protein MoaE [Nevskiales bacterium]|nr:molybdenum cofactor biosynthesis protein MoaE [Nevskiales bacterium]